MDLDKVTRSHLKIRDKRAAIRRKFEEDDEALKSDQRKLEAVMLDHLNSNNLESTRTLHGTFYRQESIKPSAADWSAIWDWAKDNDAPEIFERRLKATFIKEHMEMHDGALPPGVNVHREYEVRVRKAS